MFIKIKQNKLFATVKLSLSETIQKGLKSNVTFTNTSKPLKGHFQFLQIMADMR